MAAQTAEVNAHSRASPQVVWDVLADGANWAQWGPWTQTDLEQEGDPPPDGLGAIRRMTSERRKPLTRQPYVIREQVEVFDPPNRFGYAMLSGLPVRDYHGLVELAETAAGTDIVWRVTFAPQIPGTGAIARPQIQKVIADVAKRAAAEADRRADGGGS